jgi:hypothetical protein
VLQPITKLRLILWVSWSAPSKPLWNCCYTTPYDLFSRFLAICQSCQNTSQPWCGKVKNTPTRTYDDICHYFLCFAKFDKSHHNHDAGEEQQRFTKV